MISRKAPATAIVLLTLLAPAACARLGTYPPSTSAQPSSAPVTVPPDCDISRGRLGWSDYTKRPLLTRVSLFRTAFSDDPATHQGEDVLHKPFVPSITGVQAPARWLPQLAKSLAAETGDKIHAKPPPQEGGQFMTMTLMGREDPSIPENLIYHGVEAVSATFSVDCSQPVQGTFTSWSSQTIGGVDCGQIDEPSDPFARLARRYCPRTPAPQPSSLDAEPFNTAPPD